MARPVDPSVSSLLLPDFDSCRARLARGKEKLDALNGSVTTFFANGDPYRLVPEDADDGQVNIKLEIVKPAPVDWGDAAGEIGNDLRSALDHLVYQLAIESQGSAPPKIARTQFPIFLSESEYRRGKPSQRDRALHGVAPRHRRIIDDLQPYQRGPNAGRRDPLEILRSASNRDKHRDRHTPAVYVKKSGLLPAADDDGVHPMFASFFPNPYPAPKHGQTVFAIARHTNAAGVDVPVRPLFTEPPVFGVAFIGDDDEVVLLEDLDRLVMYVAGIIDRFESRVSNRRRPGSRAP